LSDIRPFFYLYRFAQLTHQELIPEFFDVGNSGFDFLINARNLNLGITQTGERLHDVILPPWAKSARDFVRKNRKALESEYATLHLPKWIDLIFGAKSRGDKALKANNLFHKMAYLGPTDLSRMATEEERAQAELQATEFGIVPDQLFTSEHPMKQLYNNNVISSVESVVNIHMSRRDEFPDLSYDYVTNAHEDATPLVAADHPWELLDSPSKSMKSFDEVGDSSELGLNSTFLHPKILPISGPEKRNTAVFEGDGKSEYHKLGDSTPKRTAKTSWLSRNLVRRKGSEDVVLVGEEHLIDGDPPSPQHGLTSLDFKTGNVRTPFASGEEDQGAIGSPTECFMKQLAVKVLHADTVSSCALLHQQGVSYLISCGLDGNFIVQIVAYTESRTDIVQNPQSKLRILSRTLSRTNSQSASSDIQYPQDGVKLTSFRSHSGHGPISCMVLGSDSNCGPVAFTGGYDDSIVVYGVKTAEGLASLNSHTDAVTGLHIIPIDRSRSPSFQNIVPESATHFLTSCSWDGTVKVWSVRCEFSALDYDEEEVSIIRDPLIEFYDANTPVVCVSSTYTESGIVIAAGCNDGSVFIWLCSTDGGESNE
jgi:WD40 repeat protein